LKRTNPGYWWENSADAIIFTCNDSATAESLKTTLKPDFDGWKKAIEDNGSIQADSGRFELGQIPVVDRTNFTEKLITASVKNERTTV
jgi:peptidyl-prolyl cis-trans isomerase SurA